MLNEEKIFQIVDSIPWENFKEKIGNSGHISNAIRGLISPFEYIQADSYWKIENHVVLQRDLFEGAFYLTPFLLALLEIDIEFGQTPILDLLYEIANGSADIDSLVKFDIHNDSFVYYTPNKEGIILHLEVACRNAVLCGLNTLLKIVNNPNNSSRSECLRLLRSFTEHKFLITCQLKTYLIDEKDEVVRGEIETAIHELNLAY